MTLNDLMGIILKVCPNATVSDDSDGQIVVHTGMTLGAGEKLVDAETGPC